MEHIRVENIEQFNHYFHQPTYHPQVSVARLQDADLSLFEPTDFCMYCVVLMEVDFGELVLHEIPGRNHVHHETWRCGIYESGQSGKTAWLDARFPARTAQWHRIGT